MKKNLDGTITFDIAFRDKDHITLGEDGLDTLRLLLSIGRSNHFDFLSKKKYGKTPIDEWTKILKFRDKVIQQIFMSAKKVVVEINWDRWAKIEKELEVENRRLNK